MAHCHQDQQLSSGIFIIINDTFPAIVKKRQHLGAVNTFVAGCSRRPHSWQTIVRSWSFLKCLKANLFTNPTPIFQRDWTFILLLHSLTCRCTERSFGMIGTRIRVHQAVHWNCWGRYRTMNIVKKSYRLRRNEPWREDYVYSRVELSVQLRHIDIEVELTSRHCQLKLGLFHMLYTDKCVATNLEGVELISDSNYRALQSFLWLHMSMFFETLLPPKASKIVTTRVSVRRPWSYVQHPLPINNNSRPVSYCGWKLPAEICTSHAICQT